MLPHPSPTSRPSQLDALTGLRFLAAAAVFISHVRVWFRLPDFNTGPLGSASVGFFFALSGFILSHVYRANPTSKATFYKARFARIWPLHVACIAIVMMTPGLAGPPRDAAGWGQLACHVTLTQAWTLDMSWALHWNGPAWSLSVEAFFYLLFPLTVALRARQILALYALTTIATLVAYANSDAIANGDPKAVDTWVTALSTLPPLRLQEFLAGLCAHAAWVRRPDLLRNPSVATGTLLEIASIALVVICFLAWGSGQWGPAWMATWNRPIAVECLSRGPGLSWAFAALIFVFASAQGWISRVLSHPSMVYLGEISFAFYLVHAAVMSMAVAWAGDFLSAWERPCLVAILWSIGASALLFALIETPARKAIMHKSHQAPGRWRSALSSAAHELRRAPALMALGIGAVGCAIATFAPLTAVDYCIAVTKGTDPRLVHRPITAQCVLLGATTRILPDIFECTVATTGDVPEGTGFYLVALSEDGSLVRHLDCDQRRLVTDGSAESIVLNAKSPLPQLAGASILELRLSRTDDPSYSPVANSEKVEILRLPR